MGVDGGYVVKAKKFFLNLSGAILIVAAFFPLGFIVISIQGTVEAVAGILGGLFFVGLIFFAIRCFVAARRINGLKTTTPSYSDVDQDNGISVTSAHASVPASSPVETPAAAISSEAQPNYWSNFKVDYVLIAHSSERTKAGSAITRGVVGNALLGPVGLLAAASAKKNGFLDLIIHYKNGHVATKRVKVNSAEYKEFARYIRG